MFFIDKSTSTKKLYPVGGIGISTDDPFIEFASSMFEVKPV